MRRLSIVLLLIVAVVITAIAQEDSGPDDSLEVRNVSVIAQQNLFGQIVRLAEGALRNSGDDAYTNITLFATLYDEADEIIGEGIGFPVTECGAGLLPDFALQPGAEQAFSITLELYEDDARIERVEVDVQAAAIDPDPDTLPAAMNNITAISYQEVVLVEWIDPNTLRYGVGCAGEVFTNLTWSQADVATAISRAVEHPRTSSVTPALREALGLNDPFAYNRSFLTFAPTSRRLVYQTDIHVFLSAEPDGSFRRLIYDDLSRHSLQGLIWLPEGRFLAYYFGASGEEVRYFTASVEGQRISATIYDVTPSLIVPGPTPDGARAVIARIEDGVTGYYLRDTFFQGDELLFEGDAPGNNWPAPIVAVDEQNQQFIYLVRRVDDQPYLQCFDMQTRQLNDLTLLPLQLGTDDRAWTWLSPDRAHIALAANGVNGGLWLVDIQALGGCTPTLAG